PTSTASRSMFWAWMEQAKTQPTGRRCATSGPPTSRKRARTSGATPFFATFPLSHVENGVPYCPRKLASSLPADKATYPHPHRVPPERRSHAARVTPPKHFSQGSLPRTVCRGPLRRIRQRAEKPAKHGK